MRYSSSQYARALYDLLDAGSKNDQRKIVSDLVQTLIRHNRLNLIRSIMLDFENVWYEKKNMTKVQVEMAVGKIEDIQRILKQTLGNNIEVTEKVSPELIGGTRITVGDTRIDDTVKSRLMDLNKVLSS